MKPAPVRWFVGLSLGGGTGFTALALLERPEGQGAHPGVPVRPVYALRHLERLPAGCSIPEVARSLRGLLGGPVPSGTLLGVDRTGVGRAPIRYLADELRGRVTCRMIAVCVGASGEGFLVRRTEIGGTLSVLLQSRRLRIPRDLPEAAMLVQELATFSMRPVGQGNPDDAWRIGAQDDLVLACGIAGWLGEQAVGLRGRPRPTRVVATG